MICSMFAITSIIDKIKDCYKNKSCLEGKWFLTMANAEFQGTKLTVKYKV